MSIYIPHLTIAAKKITPACRGLSTARNALHRTGHPKWHADRTSPEDKK
jgi:hypothetical protein